MKVTKQVIKSVREDKQRINSRQGVDCDDKSRIVRKFLIRNLLIMKGKKNRNQDKSKINLKMNSLEQSGCWLCLYQTNLTRKRSSLLLRISRSLTIQRNRKQRMLSLPNESSFRHLIDYMMQQGQLGVQYQSNCTHSVLKQVLIKKLSLSIDELYFYCESIYQRLNKGKFELEMVEKITKNIHQRVVEERKGVMVKEKGDRKKGNYYVKTEGSKCDYFANKEMRMCDDSRGIHINTGADNKNTIANIVSSANMSVHPITNSFTSPQPLDPNPCNPPIQPQNPHFPLIDSSSNNDLAHFMSYKLLSPPTPTQDYQSSANLQIIGQNIQLLCPFGYGGYDQGQFVCFTQRNNTNYWTMG